MSSARSRAPAGTGNQQSYRAAKRPNHRRLSDRVRFFSEHTCVVPWTLRPLMIGPSGGVSERPRRQFNWTPGPCPFGESKPAVWNGDRNPAGCSCCSREAGAWSMPGPGAQAAHETMRTKTFCAVDDKSGSVPQVVLLGLESSDVRGARCFAKRLLREPGRVQQEQSGQQGRRRAAPASTTSSPFDVRLLRLLTIGHFRRRRRTALPRRCLESVVHGRSSDVRSLCAPAALGRPQPNARKKIAPEEYLWNK